MYFFFGAVALVLVLLAVRSFVRASPANLAQGLRAFVAAFSALASTGLLFSGRFGLALITIGATVMAIRAMSRAQGGAGSFGGPGAGQRSSEVTTDTLAMQLDHRTGELEGEVLRGRFAGRSLASLGVSDLLELLADCQREDPRSVPLLETYLDRRAPDWRADAGERRRRRAWRGAGRADRDGRGDRLVDPGPGARRERGRDQGRASPADDQAAPGPRRLGLPRGAAQPGQGLSLARPPLTGAVALRCYLPIYAACARRRVAGAGTKSSVAASLQSKRGRPRAGPVGGRRARCAGADRPRARDGAGCPAGVASLTRQPL